MMIYKENTEYKAEAVEKWVKTEIFYGTWGKKISLWKKGEGKKYHILGNTNTNTNLTEMYLSISIALMQ